MKWKWVFVYCMTAAGVVLCSLWLSRAVTVMVASTPPERKWQVIIDAGHGGEDGGAISPTGIPESSYNLDISLRLNDLFRFLGYDTRMIRSSDISVYTDGNTLSQKKISDLRERVRIVNSTKNGLLVSIHQNTFSDSRYRGAQVFYAADAESKALAKSVQHELVHALNPDSSRQSKQSSSIYLMEHITQPGILIECGFLSNPEEETLLQSRTYQQKLCCVIASAIDTYLSNT